MSIERGHNWGARQPVPNDLVIVADSAAAVELIAECRRTGRPLPPIGLLAGDLVRTFGGPSVPDLSAASEAVNVTVDLGVALCDGRLHFFLDHVVARRSWLRGRLVAVANAAFLGKWNLAPRAHPGDGKLDVLETHDMSLRDRWNARHRLPTGSHLPHPAIRQRQIRAEQFTFSPELHVWIDGQRVPSTRHLSVRVEADAVSLWF